MSEQADPAERPAPAPKPESHRVRPPGFRVGAAIGLGDAIQHATASVGIKPCGGCEQCARRLNYWRVFTPQKGG